MGSLPVEYGDGGGVIEEFKKAQFDKTRNMVSGSQLDAEKTRFQKRQFQEIVK